MNTTTIKIAKGDIIKINGEIRTVETNPIIRRDGKLEFWAKRSTGHIIMVMDNADLKEII